MVVETSGDMLGTDIVTRETYRDFELSLVFKVSPGGNSGIFYRVVEGDTLVGMLTETDVLASFADLPPTPG